MFVGNHVVGCLLTFVAASSGLARVVSATQEGRILFYISTASMEVKVVQQGEAWQQAFGLGQEIEPLELSKAIISSVRGCACEQLNSFWGA